MIMDDSIHSGFYFLRHGESVNNQLDRVNGWTDSPLTTRGECQARAAAHIFSKYAIERIVTSDLRRARRTAEIVAEVLKLAEIEVLPDLRERNWGIYENQPREIRPSLDKIPEGGEGPHEYRRRVMAALKKINPNESTLIVAHAGTMRVLKQSLGVPDNAARVQNSSPLFIKNSRPIKFIRL